MADTGERIVKGVCHHDCPDSCGWEVTVAGEGEGVRAVKLRGAADHPFSRGELCPKVNRFLDRVYHPDRLLHPLVRVGPKGSARYERATWDEALDLVARELQARIERHGAATVLPYGYAGTQGMVQMASISARFFNRMGASRLLGGLCGNVAAAGVAAALGTPNGIDSDDLRHSRLIVLWGTNTLVTNRHLWPVIEEARAAGATVVCVDPLRTATAAASDWHVQPLPGTDAALALGLMHVLVERDLIDHDYVERHTVGFTELRERAASYPPGRVADICGLPAADIERLAELYGTRRPAAIRLLIGMEHREHGGEAFRAVACLPALVGAWRDRGGGLCRSLGTLTGAVVRQEVLTGEHLAPGHRRGIVMGQAGRALTDATLDPPITALVVHNSNPAVIAPDQRAMLAGLERDDLFTVVLEQFLTDTACHADVVLPATTQIEHTDLMSPWGHLVIGLNRPAVPPRGEALPNTEIFRRLSRAMGYTEPELYVSDDDLVREVLDAAAGHPWADGLTYERLVDESYVRLSRPDDFRPFADGGFPTPSGRFELQSPRLVALGLDPLPSWTPAHESLHGDPSLRARYPLALLTTKSQVRFLNSSYGHLAKHRGDDEPTLEIDAVDAAARGLADGDRARVFNDRGSIELRVRVSDRVRTGVVSAPFGWSLDASGGVGVNVLTNARDTDLAGGTAFHDNLVEVARVAR